MTAFRHLENPNDFSCKPDKEHIIYRQPQLGLISENPKEPALIISSFRKESNGDKPVLKAAFINGDVYSGDNQLVALTKIKTKNELIGEVIGLLQSPAKRVLAGLLQHHEKQAAASAE